MIQVLNVLIVSANKYKLGKVYLVGAGPGKKDLITLRALNLLREAQVVFYDHLVNPEILEYCPQAKCHYVGKVGYGSKTEQDGIHQSLLNAAKKHSVIVRLKGGDPYLLGRGGEEAQFLAEHQVPFEVVPGITSALAVPAYAGIPVTHRDLSSGLTILTGQARGDGLKQMQEGRHHTYVFLMAVKSLGKQIKGLISMGLSSKTPAAITQWGTYAKQKTLTGTLENLEEKVKANKIKSPAVLTVGEVVKLKPKLDFYENKHWFNKRILITRSRLQSSKLKELLTEEGVEVIELPLFTQKGLKPSGRQLKILKKLSQHFDWLLFTSVNGVHYFFEWLRSLNLDARALAGLKVAAVGLATQEVLIQKGLEPDFLPKDFSGESLAKELGTKIKNKKVLLARAKAGSPGVKAALLAQGVQVSDWATYESVALKYSAKKIKDILTPLPQALSFASSQTARAFAKFLKSEKLKKKALKIPALAIGPSTFRALRELGFLDIFQAEQASLEALVQKLKEVLFKEE